MSATSPPPSETLVAHDLTLRYDEAQETLSAIRSGQVDALVVSTADETPRIFILKGADDAHRVLLETLNEGAMTIAQDTAILYANQRLADLLGHPLEKVLGTPLTRYLAPGDAAAFVALLGAGREGGKGELALVTAGGVHVPVMVSMRAVGGEHETFTVVVTDLTLLKETQLALQRANDELEARVVLRTKEIAEVNVALRTEIGERTRLAEELRRKAEQLLEADRRKDEFLSMLAHELRNPLSPILTSVEMLRLHSHTDPAIERYRGVIERQTKNLTRLVDDLLDISRITRGAITLRRQEVQLGAIVQSVVDATRPLIDACGHRLTVRLPSEPVPLHVDPTRFEQVLVNLVNNAAKYTEAGGQISLTAERDGARLVIRVKDNGMGISPELLPHVFDLFVQGERSLARSQGGLGIGLTLVKRLVDMHGGTIEAFSGGAGQGSELVVHVPISAAVHAAAPRSPAPPSTSKSSKPPAAEARPNPKVLVVEDNPDAAEMLVELLEVWGFDVRSADNGTEALGIAAEFQPDAALIDIGLPGMDGYEIARHIRRTETSGKGPLLIGVTGYGQESDRRLGAMAGFDHHLVKPLDAAVLRQLLLREQEPANRDRSRLPDRDRGSVP